MTTRKIKDAKDLSTNELIYFKGHAKATYMSDGSTVEDTIKSIKINSDNIISSQSIKLNNYITEGVYNFYNVTIEERSPVLNNGVVSGRLTVLVTENGDNKVITQVINLNNNQGGEGNVYIRSQQNDTWKSWGKLQTNIEVGQITPDDMSNLIDNGIYSGVCVDGTTIETFVLIVINNYLAASQAGFGSYVSQLKYAIDLNRGNTVKTRTRDAYGIWNEWSEIGGSENIPIASHDRVGGIRLGDSITIGSNAIANVKVLDNGGINIGSLGISLKPATQEHIGGIYLGSGSEVLGYYGIQNIENNPNQGIGIKLGTSNYSKSVVPLTIGSIMPWLGSDGWECDINLGGITSNNNIGISIDEKYFGLNKRGLTLVGDIETTKVTWDANSNMNNYTKPGIYDIYGERTNSNDNLPITQAYNGASIAARLTVIASTLQPENTEKCITQFLQLSNRMGGDGNTYIRSYNENNNGLNGWSPWQKQMGMVETLINSNDATVGQEIFFSDGAQKIGDGLNGMIDNGMYSGIFIDNLTYTGTDTSSGPLYYLSAQPTFIETFVLVVINDYTVSSQAGTPRRISQLKYATDTITGQCTVKKRVGTGSDTISWSNWEEIGGGEVDITDAVKTYGLPTLISLGLVKEGVVYIVNSIDSIPIMDSSDKIATHIKSMIGDAFYLVIFKILVKNLVGVYTAYIDCYLYGDTSRYYKYVLLFGEGEEVRVSTDMETLPSTIDFTITINDISKVYTVKRGTTWGEAIYKYENIGSRFMITLSNKGIIGVNGGTLYLNSSTVHSWDVIIENDVYTISEGGSAN